MPYRLRTPQVMEVFAHANEMSLTDADELRKRQADWLETFQDLYAEESPRNYPPILMTVLAARVLSEEIDVLEIRGENAYSAELIGKALTQYAPEHQIDVRTDSTNILNAVPFIRQERITPDLSANPAFAAFYAAAERVQNLTSGQALEALAVGFDVGRANWPSRTRRFQANQTRATGSPTSEAVVEPSGDLRDALDLDALREACADAELVIADPVLVALVGALRSGKHVILTGPPGTAKTSLAVLTAELASERGVARGHVLATATSDWSTYDTIGGLSPQSDGTLQFRPGRFIEALTTNRWLIVDELNRSNFDRAFGPLFTALSGADVDLPYLDPADGRPLRIRAEGRPTDAQSHEIVVPATWRMLATINNFDKSLLFEMSFALMRRFAFVEVPAPEDDVFADLARRAVSQFEERQRHLSLEVVTALLPTRALRNLGPAMFIDAARMAAEMASLSSGLTAGDIALKVFYSMLLPQFEGVEEPEGETLYRLAAPAVGKPNTAALRDVLREVLGLALVTSSDVAAAEGA